MSTLGIFRSVCIVFVDLCVFKAYMVPWGKEGFSVGGAEAM